MNIIKLNSQTVLLIFRFLNARDYSDVVDAYNTSLSQEIKMSRSRMQATEVVLFF